MLSGANLSQQSFTEGAPSVILLTGHPADIVNYRGGSEGEKRARFYCFFSEIKIRFLRGETNCFYDERAGVAMLHSHCLFPAGDAQPGVLLLLNSLHRHSMYRGVF